MFRDDDELPASEDLGGRLRDALDRSRHLIVVASPAAAGSTWVDAEVRHFIDAGRSHDILVVVRDGEPGEAPGREPLPAALRHRGGEPLWVDARGRAGPDRKALLRLVAGMLETGFDALWRRDRRRRRRTVATWSAITSLLAALVGGVLWQQQRIAEEAKPQHQVASFRRFLVADILEASRAANPAFKEADVDVDIVRTNDLNGDSLVDFFVHNRTLGFCGSGGCATEVYLPEGRGSYRVVLDLFASTTPRTHNPASGRY